MSEEHLAVRREVFRAGCEKLMEAGEHPNILPILGFDSQKLEIHVPERKLLTLREIYNNLPKVDATTEKRKATIDLIRFICDSAAGAEFLAKNGLVLEDLKLENIAKDLDRDVAVLFDLDFIVEIGKRRKIYPVFSKSYCPPEWTEKESKSLLVPSEKEMVYELGVALKKILLSPHTEMNLAERGQLTGLVAEMVQKKPEKRLTVSESAIELKSIISSFPESSHL
jgi:serine/threonine protein kinase